MQIIPFEPRNKWFGIVERKQVDNVIADPLVCGLWQSTAELRRDSQFVGQYVARARHSLEGQLGLTSLEVPLSHVCDSDAFTRFVAAILANLPQSMCAVIC